MGLLFIHTMFFFRSNRSTRNPAMAVTSTRILRSICAVVLLTVLASAVRHAAAQAVPPERAKKVFAHYMGCFPAGTGALNFHYETQHVYLNGESKGKGFELRNFALLPQGTRLDAKQSAELEIKRGIRMGLDGFAVDAWAGGEDAKKTINAMFEIAEECNLPFEVTICLDPNTGGGGANAVASIKWLLEKHGKSAKLARRDGKPLIFGYQSVWTWVGYLQKKASEAGFEGADWEKEVTRLRTTPDGWKLFSAAHRALEKEIGQPIYWHTDVDAFFFGVNPEPPKGTLEKAMPYLAQGIDAIGAFIPTGEMTDAAVKGILDAGAEFSQPVMVQYACPPTTYFSGGPDWCHGTWLGAINRKSTLIQITTWNDYNEGTTHSPGIDTRYALFDLTAHMIQFWKTGKEPSYDHDKLYIFHPKYPNGSKIYPCPGQNPHIWNTIYIVSILQTPATLRLVGRKTPDGKDAQWEAPAGYSEYKLDPTPGPVVVETVRDGKIVGKLESNDPITDKPFRMDTTVVGDCTDFMMHWKADFGDAKPFIYSEYGDADHDGLPNWFEMFWFGKFNDWPTATTSKPDADPDNDGKTNLEEFNAQTDPTLPAPPKGMGDPMLNGSKKKAADEANEMLDGK
jgi:hypothetical protein